jgi:hypothetical protein
MRSSDVDIPALRNATGTSVSPLPAMGTRENALGRDDGQAGRGGQGDRMKEQRADRTVCPICGRGRLIDMTFDGGTGERVTGRRSKQLSDSSEVDVYDCGHEVAGASLDRADRALGIETRTSDETVVDPTPEHERRRGVDGAV